MEMKYEYTLTFQEALDLMFTKEYHPWFQGEKFKDGVIITFQNGKIQGVNFNSAEKSWDVWDLRITAGIYKQKYRQVYTQVDAMRRG